MTSRDRGIGFFVFGFLLACYLFTYTGVIQSSDGLAMFATAESIVRRGEIDTNQLLWMGSQQGNLGSDGDLYSRKGLGMTLLALPLVWLAKTWAAIGLVQTALLLNPILTAWTGALVFRAGRRLGWGRRPAVATALIFGLATPAWPYTQTFFSDPVCSLGLFGAFYGLLSFGQSGRKRYLLAGGIAWGIAYLARVVNLVTLPIYGLALLAVIMHQAELLQDQEIPWSTRLRTLFTDHWRPMISFSVPVVIAGLLSLWWNWARYGSVWNSGYVETERFNAIWWFGIGGLLFGPARGLLWYSPALLLAIPGAVWFWRHVRSVLFFCLTIALLYVLLYGKWYMWHGGYSWGPRFLVPTLPFLALLTGPAWDSLVAHRNWGWLGRIGALVLIVLSVGVQWLGMLVPFALAQDWLDTYVQPLFAAETFTQIAYSPLVLQWQFLSPDNIHLAWWRDLPWPQTIDWRGFSFVLSAILVGIILLVRRLTRKRGTDLADNPHHWLYGFALCIIAIVLLTYYHTQLTNHETRLAAQRIAQLEQQGDAILHLRPADSEEFADVYHGNLPAHGLAPQGALNEFNEMWLRRLQNEFSRLWIVPDNSLPEQSGWERALRFDDFLLVDTRMAEPDGQRLALYALTNAHSLPETGVGTIFGDPATIESGVGEDNGWIRLQGYALTPSTHPGGELLLALRWENLRPVDYNYHVFVHLLNANDEKLAQRDGQPVQWMRPTSTWQPGEELIDRYGLLLPADLPVGSYTIAVGLYDPESGQRLPVSAGPRDYAIELGPILVTTES